MENIFGKRQWSSRTEEIMEAEEKRLAEEDKYAETVKAIEEGKFTEVSEEDIAKAENEIGSDNNRNDKE